ncbi:MAG: hypothetical protein VX017_06200 [Pseudomonadota bacterium]|nr:hypothetical protein [Pseudomonadota bacterium]
MAGNQGENDDGWQRRAEMALSAAAAAERLVTYAELADAAGISGRHRINRLTAWLETQLEREVKEGTRLLSARVISRARGGLPAPGFFLKCAELGIYDGPPEGPQALAFHLNCLR